MSSASERRLPRLPVWIGLMIATITTVAASASAEDWPMRGRDSSRNAVSSESADWIGQLRFDDLAKAKSHWSATLGTRTSADPVVANGLVWVGTNNGHPRDPHQPHDGTALMCFRERDGNFLYQFQSPRLETHLWDFPLASLASSPLVEGHQLWFCNNRCEVICLDISPLLKETGAPQVAWKVDLRKFGVVPRGHMFSSHVSQCSVAAYRDFIYVNTTHAPTDADAAPAPSLVCLRKSDGAVQWKDNLPGSSIFDAQIGNPIVVEIQGRGQVVMGQGDGWLRGRDALSGELLWTFNINPKSNDLSTRRMNNVVSMPVMYDGRLYIAAGRNLGAMNGSGRLCCIDPSKRGDISSDVSQGESLPNSALAWEYLGRGLKDDERLHRTLASPVIHLGLVFIPDYDGIIHCLDAKTGGFVWSHDATEAIPSSPLIVNDNVVICSERHILVFDVSRKKTLLTRLPLNGDYITASPVFANGVLYVASQNTLFALGK